MNADQVIAETANQREAQSPEYTVADAIRDAQFYRTRPDIIVDSKKSRLVMDTLLSGLELSRCYLNAVQRGQQVFVLVEQDRAAPVAINMWAALARDHGCPQEKVDQAFATAERWHAKPVTTTKWPD